MTDPEAKPFEVENTFAQELDGLFVDWKPDAVPDPEFVVFNEELACGLGADPAELQSDDGLALLVGNATPRGVSPIAWPMPALDVPTTRALAVAETGEKIMREGLLPGAILTRSAASHIRVGTFEYAVRLADADAPTEWLERWHERLAEEGTDIVAVATAMDLVDPVYIPGNHLLEKALDAAVDGDLGPCHELLERVTQPYGEQAGVERFTQPASDEFGESFQTFCGT